jgi:hypothetical protein
MALLKYLVRKGLPDQNGPLSESLSSREMKDCDTIVKKLTSDLTSDENRCNLES